MYKTKAVRKAARWAKNGVDNTPLPQYKGYVWYEELLAVHSPRRANLMVADAIKSQYKGGRFTFLHHAKTAHVNGVVVFAQTNYWDDWRKAQLHANC